ncbi:MAG: hypothetical protein J7M26_01395, partial [Armatimonadetes bacterium]|nr:hypothetical protein [Armatimonadota bacterium]
MLVWTAVFLAALTQAAGPIDLPPSRATVSRDVGRQGNVRGGAMPDVGDELAWTLPKDLTPGVYQVVVVGRSGARSEGLDFVGAYRVVAPSSAFPKGLAPHELTVFVPPGTKPTLVSKGPSYYVFRAPMRAREKLFLRPGDTLRVHAFVGWAHVYSLRLEPVPEAGQFDLSLTCSAVGGLFSSGKVASPPAGKFDVVVTNWRSSPHRFVLHSWAKDEKGSKSCEQTREVKVPPRTATCLTLTLSPGKFGPFWAHVALEDSGKTVAERIFGFGLTAAPSPRDVPDSSPFGLHKSDLDQWPQIGAKWVRLWDTGDTWNRYERQRGVFDFAPLDKKVSDAERQRIRVLYVLAYTPTWASARPKESHYTGGGARAEPKDINDWRNFVRRVARRYRGRIAAYEVWNEPNAGFFTGTVEAYEKLLESAYEVIKQEDPHTTVVGISGTGGYLPWMEKVFKLGGLAHMDAVSVHTYTTPRSPEQANLIGRYEGTFDLLRHYGGLKPVWNTEVGIWQPEREGSRPLTEEEITAKAPEKTRPNWTTGWPYRPVSEQVAAEYCARTYLITLAEGVKHLFWYAWFTHGMPMYTQAGEPRLLCLSYGALSALFSQARFIERADLGTRDLFFLLFDTPQGPLAAAWSAEPEPTAIAIPQAGKVARVYDLWGNAVEHRST